jgi:hypothetical protein
LIKYEKILIYSNGCGGGGGGRERMRGIVTMIAPNGNFGVV